MLLMRTFNYFLLRNHQDKIYNRYSLLNSFIRFCIISIYKNGEGVNWEEKLFKIKYPLEREPL